MCKLDKRIIFSEIKKHGFFMQKNFITDDHIAKARQEYEEFFLTSSPYPQTQSINPEILLKLPWRKYSVGSKSGNGEPYSQLLQTTYFSSTTPGFPALTSIFKKMIMLRNFLTGMPNDYGNNLKLDEFWNACRVHHYPSGGGHMAQHKDTLFPKLLSEFELPFIQIMITFSKRDEDFHSGGGYVLKKGEKFFFEGRGCYGDLVIFDGNTEHGVDDIDNNELLDMSRSNGRMALFVSLYKNLNR